jgi:type VI protein secretion system component Hcp
MADDQRFFFLDLKNAGIPNGGSLKKGHEGWVELDSWTFSMNQAAEANVGGGQPKGTAASGRFGFTIKHAGPLIFKTAASGAFIKGPVTFEAERAGVNVGSGAGVKDTTTYLRLIFNDLVVSGRSLAGDSTQKSEHIELAFQKVTFAYAQILNGNAQAMLQKSYDMKANQVT